MISLAGKAALITGGSRGIGAATVKLFAQAGADVVFNYHRNREAAEQVEQETRKHGTRVEAFKSDLSKMADAKKRAKGSAAWIFWWPTPAFGTSRTLRFKSSPSANGTK
jgi:NAD(P)-dependent dehydrogenase (short-subunit alcohol dehydrogenase family)